LFIQPILRQESLLPQTDRATRCVSQNLASCCKTTCTSPEQIEVMQLEGYSRPTYRPNKLVHSAMTRSTVVYVIQKCINYSRDPDHAHLGDSRSSQTVLAELRLVADTNRVYTALAQRRAVKVHNSYGSFSVISVPFSHFPYASDITQKA